MGWWKEGGDVIGDGGADRISDVLNTREAGGPIRLDVLLGAIDRALHRNAGEFVADPQTAAGDLVATPSSLGEVVRAGTADAALVDRCHDAFEAIALEYRESPLNRLPAVSELLATIAFVLRPRIPDQVSVPRGFALRGLEYRRDDREFRVGGLDWSRMVSALDDVGLTRDPDASPTRSDPPQFASWTKHPDLSLEVDWHAPPSEPPWIELRGEGAGRLAALLAETCGGRMVPALDEALAELLTVPPTIHATGNATLRWKVLAAALAADPPADAAALVPVVAAGLADTDWRVRMTAVWAVGALRLRALGEAAALAPLPPVGEAGLNADDRHTLLALRDAAKLRAAGLQSAPFTDGGSGPGGARRAAFVDRIGQLFAGVTLPPRNRSEALVATLLRLPALGEAPLPRAWKGWAGDRREQTDTKHDLSRTQG